MSYRLLPPKLPEDGKSFKLSRHIDNDCDRILSEEARVLQRGHLFHLGELKLEVHDLAESKCPTTRLESEPTIATCVQK